MHTVRVFVCSCVNVITQMFGRILVRSDLMSDWTISDSFVVVCVVKILNTNVALYNTLRDVPQI